MLIDSPELPLKVLFVTSACCVPLRSATPPPLPAMVLLADDVAVGAVVGVGQLDAGQLVELQRELRHDVAGGAAAELHAGVELLDRAVRDRDRVEAVVQDAEAETGADRWCDRRGRA